MKNTAKKLVKILQDAGYEAYLAGGCVRDMLLKVEPKDYDIVTSAKPEEVQKIIPKTVEVGKSFGVIIGRVDGFDFEIATFRSEGEYKDARHPEKVYFTNAHDDAHRRDFTINGIFYDPMSDKIIDFVGGVLDINDKIIRFIGNSNDRIKEDNLRILRAIRFKNTLGFAYDKRTWEAVANNAYRIHTVSNERISNELDRMLADKNRTHALADLSDSGILKYILPEIEKLKGIPQPKEFHAEGDVFTHTIAAIRSLPADAALTLVWAVLLHDVGKASTLTLPKDKNDRIRFNAHAYYSAGIASKICRRLKFPNTERDLIVWLVKNHMIIGDIGKMGIAKRRRLLMDHRFPWLLELHKADAMGSAPKDLDLYKEAMRYYEEAKKHYEEELKQPKHIPLIDGSDIMTEFKIDAGPRIGKLLKIVEDAQLEGTIKTKSQALKYIKKYL